MPRAFISQLSPAERTQLLRDLNYLNMAEVKSFCKRHSIPYLISMETSNGRKKTGEADRKGVILRRIRHYLETGRILPETCFSRAVVRVDELPKEPDANHRVYYGQYDKKNPGRIALLRNLTAGKFRDGAIARILAREFWSKGEAPTFKKFAAAWLEAVENHKRPNPEWAFLSDRARGAAPRNWKQLRAAKATKVLKVLSAIPKSSAD